MTTTLTWSRKLLENLGTYYRVTPGLIDKSMILLDLIIEEVIRSDLQNNKIMNYNQSDKRGTFACLSCQNCTAIIKGPTVNHPMNGHPIHIRGQHTCNGSNVVYLLKCPCGKWYIGQTTRALKVRLNMHRSSIMVYQDKSAKKKRGLTVSRT